MTNIKFKNNFLSENIKKAKAIKSKNKRIIAIAEQKVNYFLKFDVWC